MPGSPAKMTGSSRKGALCADLANFVLNEPYVPNAALPAMSDAQAMSQKALAPPDLAGAGAESSVFGLH